MSVKPRRLLMFLALLALVPAQARAAITKEGAGRVKTLVESWIADQKKLSGDSGYKLDLQGDVMVEPAGDYYAVTLPYLKIFTADGHVTDVGMISLNASEADQPGQWKMRVALPAPVTVKKDGTEIYRVNVSGQRASGIWDEAMKGFVKLDTEYTDINLKGSAGRAGMLKIPKAKINYDLTKDAAGRWSGPAALTLSNIAGEADQTGAKMEISGIKASFFLDRYNPAAFETYRDKITALSGDIQKQMGKKPVDPKLASAMFDTIAQSLIASGNGIKANYELSGLHISLPQRNAPQDPHDITLPKASAGIDISEVESGKPNLGIKAGYSGLAVSPVPPGDQGLTPSELTVDVRASDIPVKEILALSKNTLQASSVSPEMKQLAGISFLFKLPTILAQAGTTLTVVDSNFGNKDYNVKMEGTAKADPTAVANGTLNSKVTVRGLDSLIVKLQAQEKTLSPADAAKLQTTLSKLYALKRSARIEKSPKGETLHIVEVAVNPQGQILVNGTDAAKQETVKKAPVPAVEKAP